jgi:hypothetical protein
LNGASRGKAIILAALTFVAACTSSGQTQAPSSITETNPSSSSGSPGVTPNAPAAVAVPDLRGLTFDEAKERLLAVGLHWEVSGDRGDAVMVLDQRPPAGSTVSPGTTIELRLAPD